MVQKPEVRMITIHNTTVLAITKQGGTHSHALLCLVVDLFVWLQTRDIAIWARHISGCLNVIHVADRLSWPNQPITSEVDIQDVGNSSSGHVCHSPQHASAPVYV